MELARAGCPDAKGRLISAVVLTGWIRRTVSPDRIDQPTSQYLLQAGAVISAALITGLRSDLPGLVTAQVTENVYDSPTGRSLLIPQGARLVGQYDAQVAFGRPGRCWFGTA